MRCMARTDQLSRVYSTERVDRSGRFGPVRLPLVECDRFVFRLEAPAALPYEAHAAALEAGARVVVELLLEGGLPLVVRVVDEAGAPIPGAAVQPYWNVAGEWRNAEGHGDEEGRARFGACPEGTLWVRAYAKGFVGRLLPRVDHGPGAPELEVVLARAGRVELRCTLAGEPLANYTVLHWSAAGEIEVEDALGARDGLHVLEEVPVGTVMLSVFAEGSAQSDPRAVDVSAELPARVAIDLEPGLRGVGRVVDAVTSAPVAGARVAVAALAAERRAASRGAARVTDEDGRFEVVGLGRGRNTLFVSADGYESVTPSAAARGAGPVEFGTLALEPRQTLEVVLAPQFDGLAFEECSVELHGKEFHPERTFAADGVARFEGVSPGQYSLPVFLPGGILVQERVELFAGRSWRVEIPLSAQVAFTVEVVPSEGRLPEDLNLLATWRRPEGRTVLERRWIPPDGLLVVETMAQDSLLLAVEQQGAWLACARLGPEQLRGGHVRLVARPLAHLLRVLAADGEPLPGVEVLLRVPEDPSGWAFRAQTDGRGECPIPEPPAGAWSADLSHPTHGHAVGLALAPRGAVTELELRADAALELRVFDGTRAVPGAAITLSGLAPGHPGFLNAFCDEDGRVALHGLAPGRYVARASLIGYWPDARVVEAGEHPEEQRLELRRVGSLELELVRQEEPLAGRRVELLAGESGARVSEWIASGLAHARPDDLRTDSQGRLRVDGLPHGAYRWIVALETGGSRSGELVVPAAGVARVRLALP